MLGMDKSQNRSKDTTVDTSEIEKFSAIASEWWDKNGKFRPLHQITPVRLQYINQQIQRKLRSEVEQPGSIEGVNLLDIGCGGGLVCEPLSRLGAQVCGIDPSSATIEAARKHSSEQGLSIDYQATTLKEFTRSRREFDVIVCLEVLEHVNNVSNFLELCRTLLTDNGVLILSTINRTTKSYAQAILAAEYILGWLPTGTHDWKKFIKPGELKEILERLGFEECDTSGLTYSLLTDQWSLSEDCSVNYFLTCKFVGLSAN